MEKILASILLLICSILLIHLNRTYKKMCLKKVHLEGLNAFFLDMLFDVSLWGVLTSYLFPVCTHIIFNFSVIDEVNVSPMELTAAYVIDTISWWIFYYAFYRMCCRKSKPLSYNINNNKRLEIIAIFILVLYTMSRISTLGVSEEEPSEWEQRLFFIIPFVNLAGYMLAIFIVFGGNRYFSKPVWYVAIVAMAAFFLGAFLGGIRGAMVNPIIWAAYVTYKLRPKKVRTKYYIAFGIFLLVFSMIQPIFMGFRSMGTEDLTLTERIEMTQRIASNRTLQNTDSRYATSNLLREMDYRYGAQGTYTVGFYRLVEKNGYVGFNCILNSFYTFMPSVLYSGKKPVSTSSDGTTEGMGMYKCVNAIDGSNNMCGFFTSGHAYWELGIIGVILFSIIPALFDFWCIKLFRRLDILGIPLYTAVFMKGFTQYKMWVSLIVMEFAQFILPVFILIFIYNALYHKSKNNKFKTAYNS